jgi:hypothetical protein
MAGKVPSVFRMPHSAFRPNGEWRMANGEFPAGRSAFRIPHSAFRIRLMAAPRDSV